MKKYILLSLWGITITLNAQNAQTLNVPAVVQEQTEWCWAAVSKCVLDYYGYSHTQCEIAEYTRSVSTWHNYGTTPCCTDALQGCNYENYNFGQTGSIQDILAHFGVANDSLNSYLSISNIRNNITIKRPFITFHDKINGSGGHFYVVYGINNRDEIFFMDPLVGYGFFPESYESFKFNGLEVWTGTNVMSNSPTPSIPYHCFDCVLNHGEEEIDCGGPCPPCGHTTKNAVDYNYSTSSLPAETRSHESITAGDADVVVLPGQNVLFAAVGDITLKPGFHAQSGSEFKAHKSTHKDLGSECRYCEPFRPNNICQNNPKGYGWDLVGFTHAKVEIYQSCGGLKRRIYKYVFPITSDGYTFFWDLHTGIETNGCIHNVFWYDITLTSCLGFDKDFYESITLWFNCQKSFNPDAEISDQEVITQDDVGQDFECTLHPNPNNGSFTIQTNNLESIEKLEVVNMLGQVVYSVQHPRENTITLPTGIKGAFFVRIITQAESVTKKIIVE